MKCSIQVSGRKKCIGLQAGLSQRKQQEKAAEGTEKTAKGRGLRRKSHILLRINLTQRRRGAEAQRRREQQNQEVEGFAECRWSHAKFIVAKVRSTYSILLDKVIGFCSFALSASQRLCVSALFKGISEYIE